MITGDRLMRSALKVKRTARQVSLVRRHLGGNASDNGRQPLSAGRASSKETETISPIMTISMRVAMPTVGQQISSKKQKYNLVTNL